MRRIELAPSGALFFLLGAWLDPLGAFGPFLLAAAGHELGHLAALRLCGARAERIRLGFGDARIETGFLGWRAELLCALAGPAVNLAAFAAAGERFPVFAAVSLLLGLFNLLPIPPLDGGRMLRAALLAGPLAGRAEAICFLTGALTGAALLGAAGYAAARWRAGLWPAAAAALLLARVLAEGAGENSVAFPAVQG